MPMMSTWWTTSSFPQEFHSFFPFFLPVFFSFILLCDGSRYRFFTLFFTFSFIFIISSIFVFFFSLSCNGFFLGFFLTINPSGIIHSFFLSFFLSSFLSFFLKTDAYDKRLMYCDIGLSLCLSFLLHFFSFLTLNRLCCSFSFSFKWNTDSV